jgi:hypothetical protein
MEGRSSSGVTTGYSMATSRLRWISLSAALVLGAGLLMSVNADSAPADPAPVRITVNTRAGLATMPSTGLGGNHAVWDSNLGTAETGDLLGAAGMRVMRYPGGSYGDIYHWETHTAPGGFVAPNTDFDTFMGGVRRAGAQAMVIANYGTGTPEEAAAWVHSANIVKGYGVKYWEIGNELYGNGHYGAEWEADNHPDKSPTGYATNLVAFAQAMKAADPTIKIGAVLTTPANWPDGVVAGGDPATWNQTVLSIAGPHIDFVILHWYPGGSSAEALSKPNQVADAIYMVREQIARYAGADAGRIGIALTELNISVGRTTQPGALLAADAYSSLLENGVFTVNWWNTHNGIGTVSTVAGHTDYDDFGLLSSAGCDSAGVCEPALNTPFAPYYGIQLMSLFARPGDQFIRAGTDQPLVSAHAVRRANGDLALLMVNKDPDNAYPVAIDYAGFTPASAAPTVHSFTNGAAAIATSQSGSASSQTLPPYSLTALVLRPAAASPPGAPGAPGAPAASAVSHRDATITWPAAVAGRHPIAKYEVYRHNGVTSEQWGETPGTSLTVHNLNPGSRYTVNVLARDTAGNVSWSSPPLTVTTAAPASSTCAVRLTDVSNWGSGFVANVDITNTGQSAIDGWTLTFAWPTGWQTLGSGWNGTWTQNGTTMTVTNADFNRQLAASGGTTTVGFVGNYSGPNILPTAFTLNGTVCTNS